MTITDLTQVRASSVPAVPKEITATQRLAALELAQRCEDYCMSTEPVPMTDLLLRRSAKLLRELAR